MITALFTRKTGAIFSPSAASITKRTHFLAARVQVVEERDTADPQLMTQLLMAILAPYGRPVRFRSIEKHIRDEVFWDRAKLPWRRSAVWQTIKVAIQLCLVNSGLDESLTQYKNYMSFLTAKLSQIGRSNNLPSHLLFVINAKIARRASKMASLFDFVERTLPDTVLKGWVRDSGGEVARFFFLEKCGNILIIRKTDVRKHAILSHFPMAKTPDSNFQSKHIQARTPCDQFCTYDDQIPPEFFA